MILVIGTYAGTLFPELVIILVLSAKLNKVVVT